MRFMVMHKMTEDMEKGLPPDPATIEGVGKLVTEGLKDKVFISGEGLKPSSQRVHIAYRNGKRTVTDGPFAEAKELVGGFALMRVRSKEEAIAWCDRFAAVIGDVELFLGPVVEPWDLGVVPTPKNPPLRFLAMHRMDERSDCGAPPDPGLMAGMGALVDEMTRAGVLQATGGLAGTAKGARIRFEGGKRTVIDG
ncbi:MAG TPA: YciI family protein, partial [Polyangiaceae bacterium]